VQPLLIERMSGGSVCRRIWEAKDADRRRDVRLTVVARAPKVFTLRRLAVGLASVLLPSLIAFYVAGRYAAKVDEFDWNTAAIAGTGAATAALAVWTAALALSTADDVSSTRQLAVIEQERFKKEDEPWVVTGHGTWDDTTVFARLVNVGRGPAIGVFWEAHFTRETPFGGSEIQLPPRTPAGLVYAYRGENEWRGVAGVLLSEEDRSVEFPRWVSGPEGAGKFGLHGWYTDRDGKRIIVFGVEPEDGWVTWLVSREPDRFWSLRGRTIREDLIIRR
jgi:hypothetical protein